MKTQSLKDEVPVKDGAANLQRGIETVGGWLYLTDLRLIFEPHTQNVQKHIEVINLRDIVFAQTAWTLFLSLIPVFPNSILLSTKQGSGYRFVVSNRTSWIKLIQKYVR